MRKTLPEKDGNHPNNSSADLKRRLARYRSRVEAEGRKRSVEVIDRAIRDANGDSGSGV